MAEQKIPYVRPDGSSSARETAQAILYLLNLQSTKADALMINSLQSELDALNERVENLRDAVEVLSNA